MKQEMVFIAGISGKSRAWNDSHFSPPLFDFLFCKCFIRSFALFLASEFPSWVVPGPEKQGGGLS